MSGHQHGKGYHYKGHDVLLDLDTQPQENSGDLDNPYTYEVLESIAQHIAALMKHRPVIGVICGTELSGLSDSLENKDVIPYDSIPYFPRSTVTGHTGRLVIGTLKGIPIICMQGRFHVYEGFPLWKVTMPIRVLKLLGVQKLIVTDVAGGLNPDYKVGDIMIIKDHINMPGLGGCSALNGMNDERFGPRFPPMNNAYDLDLRKAARQVASDLKYEDFIREGVYIMLGGPSYETVAELRFLRRVGVDAVGMSTVAEVIVARHCGMKVFAFSLITNECITDFDSQKTLIYEEILDTCGKRQEHITKFASTVIQKLA